MKKILYFKKKSKLRGTNVFPEFIVLRFKRSQFRYGSDYCTTNKAQVIYEKVDNIDEYCLSPLQSTSFGNF